ncbi:MAG: TIGR01906 family membrane protein [Candidatus Choladocola sp.]|nr:TIGR01906 family membrane protein [Candidatus Choladocola sp.]
MLHRKKEARAGKRELKPRKRTVTITNLLLALIGFLFLFSLSVVIVLNLRSIYYYDIRSLKLEEETGLSEEIIRENYDTLIDYNLITKRVKKLEFPSFPMSEHGRIHFVEVKRIFYMIQYLCIVTGILLLAGLIRKLPRRDYGSLKLISIFTLSIPLVLGVAVSLNWEYFFIKFHELFFRNDYWIFDPVTDPVILILPDEFFFHCAAAILFFLLLGCILFGAAWRLATRKYRYDISK